MGSDPKNKKKPSGDYEVGYCRPPKSTRWSKGESGNRAGRKKKIRAAASKDVGELLREALEEVVQARDGDKEIRLSLKQLLIRTLMNDLVRGTPAHRLKLFKELKAIGALAPDPSAQNNGRGVMALIERLAEEARLVDANAKEFPTDAAGRLLPKF